MTIKGISRRLTGCSARRLRQTIAVGLVRGAATTLGSTATAAIIWWLSK